MKRFVAALPADDEGHRGARPHEGTGRAGEPLYLDVRHGAARSRDDWDAQHAPKVVGGRYGLSSKEFTPAMVKAVFDNLAAAKPKNHFTVGINDDVTHTSLDVRRRVLDRTDDVVRAVFYGLGADGTVGANKNSIKIIGEEHRQLRPGLLRLRLEEVRAR